MADLQPGSAGVVVPKPGGVVPVQHTKIQLVLA